MRFFAPQGRHVAPMGVKFGTEEGTLGPLLRAKFHPHRCNVSPLRGEKPQNCPLSKLNTGRFALRAMLPVIRKKKKKPQDENRMSAFATQGSHNNTRTIKLHLLLKFICNSLEFTKHGVTVPASYNYLISSRWP